MTEPPRHGASAARHALLRLAVLPAALVAAIATVVVAYLLGGPGGQAAAAPGGGPLWGVLAGAALLSGAVVTGAAVAAADEAGARSDRLAALCRQAARGRVELRALLRKLEQGERIGSQDEQWPTEPEDDELGQLRHEIAASRRAAQAAVAEATTLVYGPIGDDERVAVFVGLARRMQSLVHRQLEYLDELQNDAEDPELLKGLCHVEHQAARIRRHAENLAVLGGSVSRHQWNHPVRVCDVLRSTVAEAEHYSRVTVAVHVDGTVRGDAVADIVHLLVELVQNATEFSAPQTRVLLRAHRVTAGLSIEVEDRGLGMAEAEQGRMNAVLSAAEHVAVGELLAGGRIGLSVVSALARRHRIAVQLQHNIYGGVQAVVVLPPELLGEERDDGPQLPHPRRRHPLAAAASDDR
jgi:signal transduction histidine kinase